MVLIVHVAIKHVHTSKCNAYTFKIAWNCMKLSLLTDELAMGKLVYLKQNTTGHFFYY